MQNSICAIGSSGYLDCDNLYATGCEVNPSTNPQNCGTCGHACANNQACVGGMCQ